MTNEREGQAIHDRIMSSMADDGMVIEGGWQALEAMVLTQAVPAQREAMRFAYFAGAQHLFAALMAILDPGNDATERDLERIQRIARELAAWSRKAQQADGGGPS